MKDLHPSDAPGAQPTVAGQAYSFEWLLALLLRRGLIDEAVVRDVEVRAREQRLRVAKQRAQGYGLSGGGVASRYQVAPGELLDSFSLTTNGGEPITEDSLAVLVAEETDLEYRKIDPLKLDMALVTRTLSRPFALRHVVLPLEKNGDRLLVGVEDPFNMELVDGLRRITHCEIDRVLASKNDIVKALTEIFGFRRSVESAARESGEQTLASFEQLVRLRTVGEIEATDQPIVNAVDFLLRYAFDQRASDIHIEPRRGDSQVRLRIDGVLHNTHTIPRPVHPAIASRLKTLARMDIAEKRRPQDGRIKTVLGDREVELRVSSLPVTFGEKFVIRIFDSDQLLQDLPDLGFGAAELGIYQRWIQHPHGLILVTGPTGSGKTTTLYATLKVLADETVNVTTVEDPIEMVTDRFNQTAVQHRIGVGFASVMRAILRQDPDIIMVGEIRDEETADMAVQAALTGHLVLSTLHTNDSTGATTRLLDLGVPPFLVASTLVGVMAQRLARKVCTACRTPTPLADDQRAALGISAAEQGIYGGTVMGAGCSRCRGTGFAGRTGVYEMLDVTPTLAALISRRADEAEVRAQAIADGMRPLREYALALLARGATSAEEILRVVGPVSV